MSANHRRSRAIFLVAMLAAACNASVSPAPSTGPRGSSGVVPPPTSVSVPVASDGLPPLIDVPFFRGDVFGRAFNPGPGPTGRPALAWKTPFRSSDVWPLLVDGVLIVGDENGDAVALDGRTGEERWRFTPDDGITQSIAAIGGVVYLDGPSSVYAVDVATGKQRWVAAAHTPFRGVAVDGVVYVATLGGAMGLAADTGKRVWEWRGPADVRSTVVRVADGVAYVSAGDGRIHAINVTSGVDVWPPVQTISLNPGGVEVVGDTLYTGTVQGEATEPVGQLYAIDRATGQVRWTFRGPSNFQLGAGPVRDGILYAGGEKDGIYALRDDGGVATQVWHVDAPRSYGGVTLVGDTLFEQRFDGSIGAYDVTQSGRLRWETAPIGAGSRGPIVSGGMVFSATDEGVVAYADPALVAQLPKPTPGPSVPPTPTPSLPADPFTVVRSKPIADLGLAIPLGMAVGPDGLLYILDTAPQVTVVDPSDWHIVTHWGSQGTGPSQFDLTRKDDNPGYGGIAVGPSGRVYVADGSNYRIQVFEPTGTFITQYGRFGTGNGQFGSIYNLAVDGDENLYVLAGPNDATTKLTKDGRFLWRIDRSIVGDISPGFIHAPVVRPDGTLVISCEGCPGVLLVDPRDGALIGPFGPPFNKLEFTDAFDPAGNLYAMLLFPDAQAANVVIDPAGALIGYHFGPEEETFGGLTFGADGTAYAFNDDGLVQITVTLPSRP